MHDSLPLPVGKKLRSQIPVFFPPDVPAMGIRLRKETFPPPIT